MIEKIFSIYCDMDISKAFGHKEVTKSFATEEEAKIFIEKVKNKDPETLDNLEDNCEIILDDYRCEEVFDCGEWEVNE